MSKTTRILLWLAGWVFFLIISAIGLTALAVGHSRRQLEEYQASLEKRGEHFDVAALSPPAPPLDGNGAKKLVALGKELGEKIRADQIQPLQTMEEKSPGFNVVKHREEEATVAGKPVAWEEIREKFKPLTPLLADIRTTSQSPVLEIHPDYTKGFSMEMAGASESLKAGQFLAQEGIFFLREDNGPAAVANVQAILRLANMTNKQPVLISSLITASLLGIAQNLTWEWMQSSAVTDPDLEILRKEWAEVRITPTLIPVWRLERAMAMPYFQSPSFSIFTAVAPFSSTPTFSALPKSLDELFSMGGFFVWATIYRHADEKQFLENYQTLIDLAPTDPFTGPWTPALETSRKMQTQLNSSGIERLFSRMVLPAVENTTSRIISTQAMVHLTVTALALQRYKLAHGNYPKSLTDLVPEFLPALPFDPFDGNTLRYQPLSTGGYLLYAIGPDGADDNGDATKPKRRGPLEGKDIVWPQAASRKPEVIHDGRTAMPIGPPGGLGLPELKKETPNQKKPNPVP